MKRTRKITVDFPLYFALPFVILLFPIRFLFAWFIAAFIHEAGHITASYLFGTKILSIRIGLYGAKIEVMPSSTVDELLCVISGPLFGCLLILFGKIIPYIAFCAVIQTVYNLLPFPGNDGEKVLIGLLSFFIPRNAVKIVGCIRIIILCLICWFCIRNLRLGLFVPLIGGAVLMKCVKIPCKHSKQIVQ